MVDIKYLLIAGLIELIFSGVRSYFNADYWLKNTTTKEKIVSDRLSTIIAHWINVCIFYIVIDYIF